jgi:hypothetical protein
MTAATFREKLPSALAAIALQVGMLALLALSFEVVRHIGAEKETILVLPPLARTAPATRPMVIDGRRIPKPEAAPLAPQTLPAWATQGFALGSGANGILLAPRAGLTDCRPENLGRLGALERQACLPSAQMAARDPGALVPYKLVPKAPTFQSGIDRRDAPVGLPGASGGPIGLLFTLLLDPGAYGDRRNYSYAQPQAPAMDGAEMTRQFFQHMMDCPSTVMDDTSRKACQANMAAAPMLALTGGPIGGGGPHVSDPVFQEALAGVQARTRSLYGRPVLASGAQPGDGNEKDSGSGGAGAAAGGTGTDARSGR